MKRLVLTFLTLLALSWAATGHAAEPVDARATAQFAGETESVSRGALLQQAIRVVAGRWVRELVGIEGQAGTPSTFQTLTDLATDPALRLDVEEDGLTVGYTFRF
ncbi:MAG: hypothetical protein D6758_03465 [Gammaproteobacteria bacterium]|nr:MAG: hypothetical protein D6758_03465 [Gammaproteobacteria bacterium]